MKKILSIVIVLAAATMVSCGGNTTKTAVAAEAEAVVTEDVCCEATDSCAVECDSTVVVETAPAVEVK